MSIHKSVDEIDSIDTTVTYPWGESEQKTEIEAFRELHNPVYNFQGDEGNYEQDSREWNRKNSDIDVNSILTYESGESEILDWKFRQADISNVSTPFSIVRLQDDEGRTKFGYRMMRNYDKEKVMSDRDLDRHFFEQEDWIQEPSLLYQLEADESYHDAIKDTDLPKLTPNMAVTGLEKSSEHDYINAEGGYIYDWGSTLAPTGIDKDLAECFGRHIASLHSTGLIGLIDREQDEMVIEHEEGPTVQQRDLEFMFGTEVERERKNDLNDALNILSNVGRQKSMSRNAVNQRQNKVKEVYQNNLRDDLPKITPTQEIPSLSDFSEEIVLNP